LGLKKHAWTELYNPSRRIRKGRSSGSGSGGSQSKKIKLEKALQDAKSLSPGQGLVAEIRGQDPVKWNDSEKSFDCP
jgi:hypothetical protein